MITQNVKSALIELLIRIPKFNVAIVRSDQR